MSLRWNRAGGRFENRRGRSLGPAELNSPGRPWLRHGHRCPTRQNNVLKMYAFGMPPVNAVSSEAASAVNVIISVCQPKPSISTRSITGGNKLKLQIHGDPVLMTRTMSRFVPEFRRSSPATRERLDGQSTFVRAAKPRSDATDGCQFDSCPKRRWGESLGCPR